MDQKYVLTKPYSLENDEKATPVMIYTRDSLARGEAITKENIRVSTWLRTQGAPEFVHLRNAHVLTFGGAGSIQPQSYSQMFVPTEQIVVFHIMPPAQDPPDYDATEPNRKMEPVTILVGTFRMNGHVRMVASAEFYKFVAVTLSTFMSFYDVEISNPYLPNLGVLRAPMVLIRPQGLAFAQR